MSQIYYVRVEDKQTNNFIEPWVISGICVCIVFTLIKLLLYLYFSVSL